MASAAVVAVVQAAQRDHWSTVIVLRALAVFGIAAPLADAALSRHSDRVADHFTVEADAGLELACALGGIRWQVNARQGVVSRMLARHPAEDERIVALRAVRLRASWSGPCVIPVVDRLVVELADDWDADLTKRKRVLG